MNVYGKERHFLLTVGACAEIAEFCPDNDIGRISEVLRGPYDKSVYYVAKTAVAMNKGYEMRAKYAGNEWQAPLTVEEVLSLEPSEIAVMEAEIVKAFTRDSKTTVKTQSKKNT